MIKNKMTIILLSVVIVLTLAFGGAFLIKDIKLKNGLKNQIQLGDYDFEKNVLIEYKNFKDVREYIEETKENYELIFFGSPDILSCYTYAKAFSSVMYDLDKPIIAFDVTDIQEVIEDGDTAQNSEEYDMMIDWILTKSDGKALSKCWLKEASFETDSGGVTKLIRLYMPKFFLVKDDEEGNKKIIDCFRPEDVRNTVVREYKDENGNEVKVTIGNAESKEQQDKLKEVMKKWLNDTLNPKEEEK